MIVAHLPAGYLIARAWRRVAPHVPFRRLVFWAAIGAVAPDIDLVWAVFADHWAVHHHRYVTHWPLFWLAAIAVAETVRRRIGGEVHVLAVFVLGVASHLVLDWMVSDVWWAMPFADLPSHLLDIEPRYRPWYLNFVRHWSGGLDVGIAAAGMLAAMTDGLRARRPAPMDAPGAGRDNAEAPSGRLS